jgi:hypothetical protein
MCQIGCGGRYIELQGIRNEWLRELVNN